MGWMMKRMNSYIRRFLRVALAISVLWVAMPQSVFADTFTDGMKLHLQKKYYKSAQVFHGLARAGNIRAKFMMGTIYEQGLGVPPDLNAAAFWYQKAASGGNPSAQYNLGIFYQFGKGVQKSDSDAALWLLRAANNGHGKAQNNLSTFYFTGVGVKKDNAEAWKWLSLAAENLNGAGRGIVLKNRDGIEKEMSSDEIADAKRRLANWRVNRKK